MAAIEWDVVGERTFEQGLDRGVLLFPDGGGVAWNGLASIDENAEIGVEPFYFDGVKFTEFVTVGNFSAILKAYTYPQEFLKYEGLIEDTTGFFIGNQEPNLFHLTYRTMAGDDADSRPGYKIHILYNLTAIPSTKSHTSIANGSAPILFEWNLSAMDTPQPRILFLIVERWTRGYSKILKLFCMATKHMSQLLQLLVVSLHLFVTGNGLLLLIMVMGPGLRVRLTTPVL